MEIGLFEPNKTTFPNLALMKISAWHKQRGDSVEFVIPIKHYVAVKLKRVRRKMVHFAFDFMKNEKAILEGLQIYKKICEPREREASVYMLTNFDTNIEEDLYRMRKIQECGYRPDVRIYRKNTAPKVLRDLARWCNKREIYSSCDFMDYIPRSDGKTIKQLYFGG